MHTPHGPNGGASETVTYLTGFMFGKPFERSNLEGLVGLVLSGFVLLLRSLQKR